MMTQGFALRVETIVIGGDAARLLWLNEVRHPVLERFLKILTWTGSLVVLLPLAIALRVFLVWRQSAWEAGSLGLGFGGATSITCAVKRLVERPRPDLSPPLVPMLADFSFLSGHTAQISAFALCRTIDRLPPSSGDALRDRHDAGGSDRGIGRVFAPVSSGA